MVAYEGVLEKRSSRLLNRPEDSHTNEYHHEDNEKPICLLNRQVVGHADQHEHRVC